MPLFALAVVIGYFWFLVLSVKGTVLSVIFFAGLWGSMRQVILKTEGGVSESSVVTVFLMALGAVGTIVGILFLIWRLLM